MKKFTTAIFAPLLLGLALLAPQAWAQTVNPQTGTTYTVLNSDCTKTVTLSNASAVAVTLPQASSPSGGGAGAGTFLPPCAITFVNLGVGTVTITPTTSTIGGGSTLILQTAQSATAVSDGANYQVSAGGIGVPSANFIANGTVASTITSLGPTGSHTTIQEWFSLKDASGTLRYIPAY